MPFLFHYIEISLPANGAIFAFGSTLLFIILTGFLSVRSQLTLILSINLLSILFSLWLGKKFIIPPNGSWFNPFGMDFVIVLTGVIIFIGVLIVRYLASSLLLKTEK